VAPLWQDIDLIVNMTRVKVSGLANALAYWSRVKITTVKRLYCIGQRKKEDDTEKKFFFCNELTANLINKFIL
jgi:hypothetical protein